MVGKEVERLLLKVQKPGRYVGGELNEVIKIGCFEFKIVKNTATKIELVRLKVNESENFL